MKKRVIMLLRDMRHVYDEAAEADKTEGQKKQRAFLESNPREFMSQMSKLEGANQVRMEKVEEQKKEPDVGSAKCNQLIDRLLNEWEKKK